MADDQAKAMKALGSDIFKAEYTNTKQCQAVDFTGRTKKHKDLMIDIAERSYSERHLKRYRTLYPVLGKVGKPKNYDRFFIQAGTF